MKIHITTSEDPFIALNGLPLQNNLQKVNEI